MRIPNFKFTIVVRLKKNEHTRYISIPANQDDLWNVYEKAMNREVNDAISKGWRLDTIHGEGFDFVGNKNVMFYWEGDFFDHRV